MVKRILSALTAVAYLLSLGGCAATSDTPSAQATGLGDIKIEGGLVSGVKADDGVTSFKGIPYAAPPVGDFRWKEPHPVKAWDGVKKCDTFKDVCPQATTSYSLYQKEFYSEPYPKMSEDCLYLNVYTSAQSANEKLPVMVWIHGGGFGSGWSYETEFNSDNLAKKGAILVTIEYRTGIFGFMAHPELTSESSDKTSGNYGILDQIAALKWVKNNIQGFGGDPNNVTVFGQSAGAMSIGVLTCSPLSKNLFQKAIFESGAGFDLNMSRSDAEIIGSEITASLNCKSIADMRKIPAADLYNNTAGFQPKSVNVGWIFLMPNVDGYVLPDTVANMISQGKQLSIPYIAGYNANDIPGFDAATAAFVDQKAKSGSKDTYFYEFSRMLPGDDSGAFHSAELWYVFQTLDKCWRPMTDADKTLADQMSSYWVNFAKTGNPNSKGHANWSNYQTDTRFKMMFDIAEGSGFNGTD